MNNKWAEMAMARVAMQHNVTLEEVRFEISELVKAGYFDGVLSEDVSAEDVITYLVLIYDLLTSDDDQN